MEQLRQICEAVRVISRHAHLSFHGVPDREDMWLARVCVSDVILFETGAGFIENVLDDIQTRLAAMSQRIAAAKQHSETPTLEGEPTLTVSDVAACGGTGECVLSPPHSGCTRAGCLLKPRHAIAPTPHKDERKEPETEIPLRPTEARKDPRREPDPSLHPPPKPLPGRRRPSKITKRFR